MGAQKELINYLESKFKNLKYKFEYKIIGEINKFTHNPNDKNNPDLEKLYPSDLKFEIYDEKNKLTITVEIPSPNNRDQDQENCIFKYSKDGKLLSTKKMQISDTENIPEGMKTFLNAGIKPIAEGKMDKIAKSIRSKFPVNGYKIELKQNTNNYKEIKSTKDLSLLDDKFIQITNKKTGKVSTLQIIIDAGKLNCIMNYKDSNGLDRASKIIIENAELPDKIAKNIFSKDGENYVKEQNKSFKKLEDEFKKIATLLSDKSIKKEESPNPYNPFKVFDLSEVKSNTNTKNSALKSR